MKRNDNNCITLFENFISLAELEKYYRGMITARTIYNWKYRGELPSSTYKKVKGNEIWINLREFDAWLLKRSS